MKRVFPIMLAIFGCLFLAGCPGGEEGDGAATDGPAPTADGGTATNNGGGGGSFKAGVDSGRAEDGSDEDK